MFLIACFSPEKIVISGERDGKNTKNEVVEKACPA